MRIALVSPYSWSYPGGVNRHVAGLTEALIADGHDVTVLAPCDPAGPLARTTHFGATPWSSDIPGYVRTIGRTAGIRINGGVSALSVSGVGLARLGRALRQGEYDVIHVHEPDAPPVGWVALLAARAPLVGTFHTYNEHRLSHTVGALAGVRPVLNHLHVRIAVSAAAAWTGRRFFGGQYRVIPNGVHLGRARHGDDAPPASGAALRIVFVGQPVARKGLPVLLRAFEQLRHAVPAELVLVGPERRDVVSSLVDDAGITALGRVDESARLQALRSADVLCAPSLGGESFGMVLTEAFAERLPVVASDIPGYRDVVHDGVEGALVPPGDADRLAVALTRLWTDPARRSAMAAAAARAAKQYEWPVVADQVVRAYRDAIDIAGSKAVKSKPIPPERRLPSLQVATAGMAVPRRRKGWRAVALGALWLAVAGLAVVAIDKMGLHNVTSALAHANIPVAVGVVALMCVAMVPRGVAWHASLAAALPEERIRLPDALRGLFIGVLVSSTLPANLGEPSRALVVARKTSRPWRDLPVIAGTMMSQTLINAVAMVVLGVITFTSANLFGHFQLAAEIASVTAVALVVALLASPLLLRGAREGSWLMKVRNVLFRVRSGLAVFRHRRLGAVAVVSLLSAWAVQWAAVYLLLIGLHLVGPTDAATAAAILFAVNVTMLLPFTPGDLGVFQATTAFVLNSGWGVPYSRGVAYGIVLQAAELLAAVVMGVPALLREGMSWRALARRQLALVKEEDPVVSSPGPSKV